MSLVTHPASKVAVFLPLILVLGPLGLSLYPREDASVALPSAPVDDVCERIPQTPYRVEATREPSAWGPKRASGEVALARTADGVAIVARTDALIPGTQEVVDALSAQVRCADGRWRELPLVRAPAFCGFDFSSWTLKAGERVEVAGLEAQHGELVSVRYLYSHGDKELTTTAFETRLVLDE